MFGVSQPYFLHMSVENVSCVIPRVNVAVRYSYHKCSSWPTFKPCRL